MGVLASRLDPTSDAMWPPGGQPRVLADWTVCWSRPGGRGPSTSTATGPGKLLPVNGRAACGRDGPS